MEKILGAGAGVRTRLRALSPATLPTGLLELLRYVQPVLDHPVEYLCDVALFDDERSTKPLRIISGVSPNPFIRPLSERPNEGKRSLWQNPEIGLTGGMVHCLWSVGFTILLRESPSKVPEDVPEREVGSGDRDRRSRLPSSK